MIILFTTNEQLGCEVKAMYFSRLTQMFKTEII